MSKPLPPPLSPWPVRACLLVRAWLAWPWTVRQLKADGWRRVGFMTWETPQRLPAPQLSEAWRQRPAEPPMHPRGPLIAFGDGVMLGGPIGCLPERMAPLGRGEFDLRPFTDETLVFPRLPVSASFQIPLRTNPLADLQRASQLAKLFQGRRELHCAPGVAAALMNTARSKVPSPWEPNLAGLMGLDVTAEGDMPSGTWEIRRADTGEVVDAGKVEL